MAKWKKYRLAAKESTVTIASGDSIDASKYPQAYCTSEDNVGAMYQIVINDYSGTDQYYVKKSVDGGDSYTTWYADGSSNEFQINFNDEASGDFGQRPMSIDTGVYLNWPDKDLYTNQTFQTAAMTASPDKIFDGGYHAHVEIPYVAAASGSLSTGSSRVYTETLPIEWLYSVPLTIVFNSTNLGFAINSGDVAGNLGTTVYTELSVDGTNWYQGYGLTDATGLNLNDTTQSGVRIAVYNPDTAATTDITRGGKANYIRFQLAFLDQAGGEKSLGQNQYMQISIYPMQF
jgi:hypothetical protein